MQRNYLLLSVFMVTMVTISLFGVTLAHATVDGAQGSSNVQGKVIVEGTITKDIPYPNEIWKGISSGDSSLFTLSGFSLVTGEFIPSGSTQNIGNITASPDKISHSKYNDSGLLDVSDWAETDVGTVLTVTSNVETADQSGAPRAMRLFITSSGATSTANLAISLATPISSAKHLSVGLRVNTESYNATSPCFMVQFLNSSNAWIGLALKEGATDYTASNYLLECDDDAGDVVMWSSTVGNLASACSQSGFGSITGLKLIFNNDSSAWQGSVSIDLFCLTFSETVLKYGKDYGDVLSAADDYVYLNVSNPSSPNIAVREFHSTVTKALDAQLNFYYQQAYKTANLDEGTGKITYLYDVTVLTSSASTYEDDLVWSSVNYWYILDSTYGENAPIGARIYEFTISSVSQVDSLINEEPGDAISIASSVTVSSTMTATPVKVVKDATLLEKRQHGNIFYVLNTYISMPVLALSCGVLSVITWGALVFKRGKVPGISIDDSMRKTLLGRLITTVVFFGLVILTAVVYLVLIGAGYWALIGIINGL